MSAAIGSTATNIAAPTDLNTNNQSTPEHAHAPHHRFISLRQLNALVISVVLAASGMVHAGDIAISLLFYPYLIFLSRYAFPTLRPSLEPPVFSPRNRLLLIYVTIGALLGLLLPILYIFEGIMEGDQEGIKAAAPHVFLLASQVFMEGVTFSRSFSLPIRAFVPITYNALRMFSLVDWVVGEMMKEAGDGGEKWPAVRLLAGRCLAVGNLAFWGFNLFGFLLPVYLPRALKRHYEWKEE